jgi:photosystem II stability/assembly factor-like uncharacterized protein
MSASQRLSGVPSLTVLRLCLGLLSGWLFAGPADAQFAGINWFPIGPADILNGQTFSGRNNASGRATAIAVNPANPSDIWLGTANGGVWHSTDGGAHWLPMSDDQASLAIGAITLDGCTSAECATIYAGTGENAIRRDTYYGMGLLIGRKSGGEISQFGWTLSGQDVFKFGSIYGVLVDPASPSTLYVALSSGVTASATESTVTAPPPPNGYGIYKSTSGGGNGSWNKLTVPGTNNAKPTALRMDPTNGKVLYAGFLGRGVFKTVDSGSTWCPLNPGIPLPPGCSAATGLPNPGSTTFDFVEIAIHRPNAASPALLYATFGNCPDPLGNLNVGSIGSPCNPSIYTSTDDGKTWSQTNPSAPNTYSRYNHALTIHPSNPATIFYGGVGLWKSTDNGQSFSPVGEDSLHPDHHSIVFGDPSHNLNLMYEVSDGGFYVSNDGGNTWSSGTHDLQISGFQSISSSPLTSRVIGGLQDNGTNMWLGTRVWHHSDDGDAGSTQMDLNDVLTMYDNYFDVDPRRSTDGGTCCFWPSITTGINTSDPAAVYAPLSQDPSPPHALYFGTNQLYKTTNKGDFWSVISPALGGTSVTFPDIQTTNVITAISVPPTNGNRIYVGYYDGQIFVTDGACANASCWRAIGGAGKGLPNSVVTRIAVDPGNPDIAYATFSGFANSPHLFKTTNAGMSWMPAANGLPTALPANTIIAENSTILWSGMDNGVYKSSDSGASWTRFGAGLPNVPVYDITIDRQRGRLFAATHGRGIYVLTQPFLTNYEGWVENDIWDVLVYGNGFVGSLANPPGSACTMQILQQDGSVCATANTDAMGGQITFDDSGQLITSKGTFYGNPGRPVALACYNGSCIGGKTIAACNPPSNPITSVTVTCGSQVGIDHILGCPAQANPPSSILGFGDPPENGAAAAGPVSLSGNLQSGSFDLVPSVQAKDGSTRALCSAPVPIQKGDTAAKVLTRARDAVNADTTCKANTVTATVRGIPPEPQRGEDLFGSAPNLSVRAPGVVGGQLFTAILAPPGSATGVCFDVDALGSPLQNQIAVMKVDLQTAQNGAAGGEIQVTERSPLGICTLKVPTTPGQTAAQIAAAVTNAFQAPGLPGPINCRANENPRDVTAKAQTLITVMASGLTVCSRDNGLGIFVGPEELPTPKPPSPAYKYSPKLLCGKLQRQCDDCDDCCKSDAGTAAPGSYYTSINLHNLSDKSATLRTIVSLTEKGGEPGRVSHPAEAKLNAGQSMRLDCPEISRLADVGAQFHEGFLVIESDVDLDVVGVYTAAGATGKIETMEVERVPARKQQQ